MGYKVGAQVIRAVTVVLMMLGTLMMLALSFFLIFFNIYLFLRQRESMNRGRSEKEGDTESETSSRL